MTTWYDEDCKVILEENMSYRRYFSIGQEVTIKSIVYLVERQNILTDGGVEMYCRKYNENRLHQPPRSPS